MARSCMECGRMMDEQAGALQGTRRPWLRLAGAKESSYTRSAMKVPNERAALVEREKITEYLLNPAHPDNGGKAPFFLALGFSREDWPVLVAALRKLAET